MILMVQLNKQCDKHVYITVFCISSSVLEFHFKVFWLHYQLKSDNLSYDIISHSNTNTFLGPNSTTSMF